MAEILTPVSKDYSPVLFCLSKENGSIRGKGFWKLNSSFSKDQNCVNEIKGTLMQI